MDAGFARINITPRANEHPEMMGFGPFLGRTALEVLQPLYVRASYLKTGNQSVLLLSLDVCGLDEALADRIRAAAAKAVGVMSAQVIAACTHTHSAPSLMSIVGWGEVDTTTARRLPGLAARAAQAAQSAAVEVTLESGASTLENFSRNRVYRTEAPHDTTVRVLAFRRREDTQLAGVWAQYACHPVVLCEKCRVISPDYCGVAMQELEERNPGAVCSFLQGACGDINPLWAHMEQERSIVHLAHAAYRFRSAVETAMTACTPESAGSIAALSERLTLPINILSDSVLDAFRADAQSGRMGEGWENLEPISRTMLDAEAAAFRQCEQPTRSIPVAAVRVGTHTLLFHPFEMFTQIGMDIRSRLGDRAWIIGYTNSYEGYAPTADRFSPMSGDYAAHAVSLMRGRHPFTSSLGERLVAELMELGRRV